MKALLSKLIGADRPKVIAVFGATRAEVESAVCHARAGSDLPIWACCAEMTGPVEGVARFFSGEPAIHFVRELRAVWVALSITAWTGGWKSLAFKLLPFSIPPFRVLILNEARGFFPARPRPIAVHLRRRTRDRSIGSLRRLKDWTCGACALSRSLAYRGGDKIADLIGLAYSLAYRGSEKVFDLIRLTWSLTWRAGEKVFDTVRLARSLAYRGSERVVDWFRLLYSFAYRGAQRLRDWVRLGRSLCCTVVPKER